MIFFYLKLLYQLGGEGGYRVKLFPVLIAKYCLRYTGRYPILEIHSWNKISRWTTRIKYQIIIVARLFSTLLQLFKIRFRINSSLESIYLEDVSFESPFCSFFFKHIHDQTPWIKNYICKWYISFEEWRRRYFCATDETMSDNIYHRCFRNMLFKKIIFEIYCLKRNARDTYYSDILSYNEKSIIIRNFFRFFLEHGTKTPLNS